MAAYEIIIYLVIGLAVFGGVGFWVFLELQYKCRIRFRELVNDRKIVRDHRAREKIDNEGVNWWRVAGEKSNEKKLIPAPPEEAIEIDKKGRKCAEAYRTQSGDIIWIKDTNKIAKPPEEIFKDIPQEIFNIEDEEEKKKQLKHHRDIRIEAWKKDNHVLEAFEPLTTKQRMIYIQNMKKAESRKGLDWKAQLIPIVSIGVLGLVIVAIIVFWGDIAKPTLEANKQFITAQELHNENLQILKEIKHGVQRIDDRVTLIEEETIPD